jgi:dsRNA-specific ribonuclease
MKSFKEYLYKLFSYKLEEDDRPIINKKYLDLMLEDMTIWNKSVTHITYDDKDNYDTMEFLGDKALKFLFGKYLQQILDFVDQEILTNYDNNIMNANYQKYLCKKIGLDKYMRVSKIYLDEDADTIIGDVFESFVDAIYDSAENVKLGLGSVYLMRFLKYLFQDEDLEKHGYAMAPKNRVNQIVNSNALIREKNGNYELYYDESAMTKFRNLGFNLPSNIIARVPVNTPDYEKKLYALGSDYLIEHGATKEAKDAKEERINIKYKIDFNKVILPPWVKNKNILNRNDTSDDIQKSVKFDDLVKIHSKDPIINFNEFVFKHKKNMRYITFYYTTKDGKQVILEETLLSLRGIPKQDQRQMIEDTKKMMISNHIMKNNLKDFIVEYKKSDEGFLVIFKMNNNVIKKLNPSSYAEALFEILNTLKNPNEK